MNNDLLNFIKKIKTRGIILSGIVDDDDYNVIDSVMLSKDTHLELIDGINFLLDKDIEFFLFERLFELNTSIKEICFDIVNNYRFRYKENLDLCNSVIGKLNSLGYISLEEKKVDLVNYYTNEISSRGLIFKDIRVCLEAMFYDYYIYNSIMNNEADNINYYDAVVSTTNYFLSNSPELYLDEKIYGESILLLNNAIKESRIFSGLKKSAKYTKTRLQDNKLRIHE